MEIINEAADAFSCAETVMQLGMLKVTGAVSIYTAHIHQMDQQKSAPQPKAGHDAIGKEVA